MLKTKRVRNEHDSYLAQHDEFETECYCSECGNYLGSKNFTYQVAHSYQLDAKMKFCKYCGTALYE